jgi:hypothetical protein
MWQNQADAAMPCRNEEMQLSSTSAVQFAQPPRIIFNA